MGIYAPEDAFRQDGDHLLRRHTTADTSFIYTPKLRNAVRLNSDKRAAENKMNRPVNMA